VTPENETKKVYLMRYLEARLKELSLVDELNTLRLSVLPSGIRYDGEGGGSGTPHGLEEFAARYDAKERELYAQLDAQWKLRAEIISIIEELPSEAERMVMRFRYINLREVRRDGRVVGYYLRPWKDIAESMHYTTDYVGRLHGSALAHLKQDSFFRIGS